MRLSSTQASNWKQQTYRGDDTIYALSTASGTAAIAIIRISGPACINIYNALCPKNALPKPRYASLRTLYEPGVNPSPETILDPGAMVLYFSGPKSVTGEDVLELHVHGGTATVKAILTAISRCEQTETDPSTPSHRIRYAQAGEFTRRAFYNARLSLPEIEALSATLAAQTEQQRRVAARSTRSTLTETYESWRTQLLHARAELEALIDFAEDQHFDESPRELAENVANLTRWLLARMKVHRENAARGELMREGIQVALLGAPNTGKSSLLNRIVGREAAIVSAEAGTTRDVVEVGVDLDGWLVKFGDMAGLRASADHAGDVGVVEREGIRRAKERALRSDVVVVVVPLEIDAVSKQPSLQVDAEVVSTALECASHGRTIILAISKWDKTRDGLVTGAHVAEWRKTLRDLFLVDDSKIVGISSHAKHPLQMEGVAGELSADGIQPLLATLTSTFRTLTQPLTLVSPDLGHGEDHLAPDMSIWQDSLGASERQRVLLEGCIGQLESFLALVGGAGLDEADTSGGHGRETEGDDLDIVIAAEHLRSAAESLASITGRGEAGDVEEVLGVVFEK